MKLKMGTLAAVGYLMALFAFIYLPIIVLAIFSFQDGRLPVPPLRGLSLQWYAALLSNERLIGSIANSIIVASVSALGSTILGFLAAYDMARFRRRLAPLMQWLILAPLFVAPLVIGMGLLISFAAAGIPRGLLTVSIGHIVMNLPVAFAVIYGQMGDHQLNVERAARDLGASEATVILRITVPMLWPAILAALLLTFTLSWDEFLVAFLLSVFQVTLPVELWTMLRRGLSPEANAAGTSVFVISAIILIAALLLRRYQQGNSE